MHFLLIHQGFATPNEPGGTRHFELTRGAVEQGHRFTVIASDISYITGRNATDKAGLNADATIEGVRVLRAFTYRTLHGSFAGRLFSFISFAASSLIKALGIGAEEGTRENHTPTSFEEAVKAMTTGASEVAAGTALAARSGAALDEIASAVVATRTAVERIVSAVEEMSTASTGVVGAMDGIAGIAETNSSAATKMTAGADAVSRAVVSIAAVSQENSAAAEEVSTATEEMTAQIEEVIASAESLSMMAEQLDALVSRFKLVGRAATKGSQAAGVAGRRTTDWQAPRAA